MSVGARVAKLMMAPYGILWGVCRWRHYASAIAGDAFSGLPLQTAGSGHPIVHLEKTFQRDIDLVVISKEAGNGLPRATQKIPAKLYIDAPPHSTHPSRSLKAPQRGSYRGCDAVSPDPGGHRAAWRPRHAGCPTRPMARPPGARGLRPRRPRPPA